MKIYRNSTLESNLGKLIIIDDDPEILKALCEILADRGYVTTGFAIPGEALEALREESFDLMLTDLKMPEMDGITLMEKAKEIDPNLVVIINTGQGTIDSAVKAMKLGALDYVLKPFKMNMLLPVLSRAMGVHQLQMENIQLKESLAIYELSMSAAFSLNQNTILDKVADATMQGLNADELSIMLTAKDGNELSVAVVRGKNRDQILGYRIPINEGVAGWVVTQKETVTLQGEIDDPRFAPVHPRPDICSSISVPMLVGGKVVGVLNVNAVHRRPFTPGETKALNILVNIAGAALENARLHEKVRQEEIKYRSIFDNAAEGIFQTTPGGCFLGANPAMARMLGYVSAEELISTTTDIAKQFYVEPERRADFIRLMEEKGFVADFEVEAYRKDGSVILISEKAQAVKNRYGNILYYEGICEDITEKRRAETALKAEREQLLSIFDSIDEIIYVSDPETYEILYANPILQKAFNKKLVGETCYRVLQNKNTPCEFCTNEIILKNKGKPYRWEYHNPILKGDFIISDRIIKWPDGRDVRFEMAMDITQRIKAEKELKENEEKYRLLFENVFDVIYSIDKDFKIMSISPSVENVLGYKPEELIGRYFQDLNILAPEYLEAGFTNTLCVLNGEEISSSVYEFIAKDGTRKFGEVSGKPLIRNDEIIGVISVARDVTEKVAAEKILHETKQLLENIAEGITDGVLLLSKDLKVIWANQGIAQMWDQKMEDIIGQHCFKVIDGLDAPCQDENFTCPVEEVLKTGTPQTISRQIANDKGEKRFLEISVYPIKDKNGEIYQFVHLCKDITEFKKLESQYFQAQKMESIGRLAGGVAHDFNNFLTSILGYAELSLMDMDEGHPLQDNMEEIRKAAKRASSVTRQLLAFSRKETIRPVVLDLNETVGDMDKMLRRMIGEDIELVTILETDLWKVKVDPGQIDQVVMNLVVNARDAMPFGGKLTIETHNVYLGEDYGREHGVDLQSESFVMISVSDTGSGIEKDVLPQIFEPFFTTKAKYMGTGLGLATVYGIIKQNNGYVWVYSEKGKGATFKVYLPSVAGEEKAARGKMISSKDLRGSETILLVEDNESVLKVARDALQKYGYTILEATDGKEGLRVSEEYSGKIHLMLTDVVMPEMSGRELAEKLHDRRPEMKVLYMSGYTDNAIVHHGILEKHVFYIQKPFVPRALAYKVREVLELIT